MQKHLSILILVLLSTNLKASNQQDQILEQLLENSETKRQYPALTANEVTALLDTPITFGYIALQEGTTIFGRSIQIATASKWAHITLILCDPNKISNNPSLSDQKNWYCFQAYAGHESHIIPWKKYIVLTPILD